MCLRRCLRIRNGCMISPHAKLVNIQQFGYGYGGTSTIFQLKTESFPLRVSGFLLSRDNSTSCSIGLSYFGAFSQAAILGKRLPYVLGQYYCTWGLAITLVLRLLHVLVYFRQCTMDMDHVLLGQHQRSGSRTSPRYPPSRTLFSWVVGPAPACRRPG